MLGAIAIIVERQLASPGRNKSCDRLGTAALQVVQQRFDSLSNHRYSLLPQKSLGDRGLQLLPFVLLEMGFPALLGKGTRVQP